MSAWRCSGDAKGFDELVISRMETQLEMMNANVMDVHFGDVHLTVWRDRKGVIRVRHMGGPIVGFAEDV